MRGDSNDESSAIPKGWHSGQLGGLAARHRRRMRASGRLDDPSPVKPEMQDEGQPKSFIRGAAGGKQATGQLETWLKPAPPKACEVRGNSNGHRRHSRRTEAKGQPEASDAGPGERERGRGNPETQPGLSGKMQGAGQLASSSTGRTRRLHDPLSYKIIRRAPEAARSPAFSNFGRKH